MLEVALSGLVTGWAIAIPIGAVGAFLVALASRTPFRVGAAAALGIASVDGGYAALAVVAGAAIAAAGGGAALGRVATGHRAHLATGLVSAVVIAGLALHTMLA